MGMFRAVRRGATLITLGMAGGALFVTARHLLETPQPLESALPGEGRLDRKHGGDIYYNVAGSVDAEPIVLLHDFYPGASNFEFRKVFPRLAERYRVFAPDWLGFGMSEHPHVAYTGEFYAGVLTGFLRDVVARPAIVIAHGHAANVAVRAASDQPALFERLVLAAPAVFAGTSSDPTLTQTLVRTSQRVALGLVPYALLATRPALRRIWLMRTTDTSDSASEESVDHLYASAHQFGGQHALLALMTGELDLPMQNAFALLEPPVLLVGGEEDRKLPRVDLQDVAVLNPHAQVRFIPGAGDAVFLDQPNAFVAAVADWLRTPLSRHTLDENALLQPNAPGPAEQPLNRAGETPISSAQTENRVQGQMETGEEAASGLLEMPTEGNEPPASADAESAPNEGKMPGTPGYVVPGVSDMGLEGLSTPDAGGITALGGESVTLGPPSEAGETAAESEITEMLPEAGDVEPGDATEHEARVGEEPPLAPASNIAEDATGQASDADRAGQGNMGGLAQIVQTPDEPMQTPTDTAATPPASISTPESAVDTDEMIGEGKESTAQRSRRTAGSQQTRRASGTSKRESGAHPEPRGRTGTSGGKRNRSTQSGSRGTSGNGGSTRKRGPKKHEP